MANEPAVAPQTPDQPSARELAMRDRIMDGCMQAIAEHGIESLKARHIIEAAGVSRQTVYNHYPSHKAILQATFAREGIRVSLACADAIRAYRSVEDKFVKGMVFMYQQLPRNPVLNLIVQYHHRFLEAIGLEMMPLKEFGRLCFGEVFAAHPKLAQDMEEMSELWARSVLSLFLFDDQANRDPAELEGYIRRRLLPGLGL